MVGSVLGLEHHDHHGGVISDMGDMVREGYELVGKFNLGDYYSTTQYQCLWGLLDFHGVGPRCQRLAARVREQFGRVMEERRKVSDLHKRDDLLSYMLSMPQEERIEDSDVIAVLWVSLHVL